MTERSYELILSEHRLGEVLDQIGSGHAALDFETTGLDERTSEVRLAQICNDDVWVVIDFWALEGRKFEAYADWFDEATWIAFNAGFEFKWFEHVDADVTVIDVANARRARMGGDKMSLAAMLKADLKVDLPKEQQLSNWAAPELSPEQLGYAALDALWTWKLWQHWQTQLDAAPASVRAAQAMFDALVPPVREMEKTGLLLDVERHRELIAIWERKLDHYEAAIREHLKPDHVQNLNSGGQLSDFFASILPNDWLRLWPRTEKTGQLRMTVDDLKKMAAVAYEHGAEEFGDVWVNLADRITVNQYLRNFGNKLIQIAENNEDGRIHPSFNIARAVTGRFSSSRPNAQQLPRDRELLGEFTSVRRSFIAPYGKRLVSLDYSGIELRVLALLTGDDQLLHDCIEGDVHLEVGSIMAGRKLDKSVPEDKAIRSKAKGVSFGIVYGSGPAGLSVTLRSPVSFAREMIAAWSDRYPRAFALRHEMMDLATADGYLPCADGGTIFVGKKPDLPKCANYPVQRAALSVMARAIIRHHARLNDEVEAGRHQRTLMAATIHDALIDEAADDDADDALRLMEADMTAGYLDVFPGAPTSKLVEGGHGRSWGELD